MDETINAFEDSVVDAGHEPAEDAARGERVAQLALPSLLLYHRAFANGSSSARIAPVTLIATHIKQQGGN